MARLVDADVLMTELSELIEGENDGSEGMKMWDGGVKSAIRIVKSAPTVHLDNPSPWIPVSERLPEEGRVLTAR